ncbi:MAG: exodeoxyribonuclease VII large subunit [Candidatus Omnitrophica bacterium CG11_big_fil_rev_8_21_14_0_20_45_26]|uniref:Exodeoxyribonuclease 7 large subunit n=1 Tax=Candidatus Abzuiibacterium crystallinum TaxID=1974748 RepID=A0A2H0LRZ4_9BACT|nr:MAG: exodeoxyribonuclease VII large subunit [Candidatus Omnitrophica bacterium CG11_big_fil_rev_8_21_14_0_20_45_26]PIW65619.1 MAG: exodeoxyribonuclease VII large subunit [Candidatus Omnitrophica bacterium CG12_big_fil_rev_8_21_14_0_65_45_16]
MPQKELIQTLDTSQKRIYKVSELTREIRLLLEDRFTAIWIEGEVSNFKHHSSGHMYFTLKDANAQLACVFFKGYNQFLKFQVEDGMKLVAFGRISVYDARGNYQLYVERLDPKGVGALQLAFLQLKEKLEREGLFDEGIKKEIPAYPKSIGIITSPTGAAIQDMLKVFKRAKHGPHVYLMAVRVQGEGAGDDIARAIDLFQSMQGIELLIVGRGGGSLEDLWAFNEEIVARAIHRSAIPVISAVGHEIDWTISDLAADLRAHTPTAAAELVIRSWEELETFLLDREDRLKHAMRVMLGEKKEQLRNLQDSHAFKQPMTAIRNIAQRVDEYVRQMENYGMQLVRNKKDGFRSLAAQLEALSPLAVLNRGFSMTLNQKGNLIRRAAQAKTEEIIQTRFSDGWIKSKVTQVTKKEIGDDGGN